MDAHPALTHRTPPLRRQAVAGLALALMGAAALVALPSSAGAQEAAGPDEAAVLQVVRDLFDGMREKDEDKLRGVFHADARLHSTQVGPDGSPRTGTSEVDTFIANVLAAQAMLDEVTFDETVLVSDNLAMAWTPYNLFVDDRFQHCGVDLFNMIRTEEGWKVLQLTDTRTREGCDPERRS